LNPARANGGCPGTIPVRRSCARPASRRYSGINRLVLWATADACGYASGIWATYQQWRANGGQVRKGAIGTHVILWKKVERGDAAAEAGGEGDSRARFFARSFVVFNRDQVDGAEDTPEKEVAPVSTSIADALAFPRRAWRPGRIRAARCLLPPRHRQGLHARAHGLRP
jgi:antirestriction protein ArdC